MTATLGLWPLIGLAVLCCLIGFLFGVLAMLRTAADDTRPGEPPAPPPLPRAGYLLTAEHEPEPYPTTPVTMWSPHAAQLAAHEREIRQMITAAGQWPYR